MQTLSSREVYANRWLSLREDVVRRPDGSEGIHSVFDSRDIALIVAADGDRLHLVEQYRYAVSRRSWEFPSGSAPDADLDPMELAARELREETGLRAGTLTRLGTLDVTPGMTSQRCAVFLASELTEGEPDREPEEQDLVSRWWTRAEVEQMITDGDLTDAKTLAAYTMLLLRERTADPAR